MTHTLKNFAVPFLQNCGNTKTQRVLCYITWTAIAAMVIGSLMSIWGICSGGCTDTEKYRFFDQPFGAVGLFFFLLLGAASLVRNSSRTIFRMAYDTILPGIAGAEWIFLGFQSRIIRSYCPVGIAIAVFVAVAVRLVEVYLRNRAQSQRKKSIRAAARSFGKALAVIFSMYVGLTLALIGTSLPVAAGSSGIITHDIWLGKADSPVEVLVVSGWYCPYCRRVEPALESALAEISKSARYTFIDDPIHKQSLTLLPAHMSLLTNAKANYMVGRKTLLDLAAGKKLVKHEEIMAALKSKGIDLTLMPDDELKRLARAEAGFLVANSVTLTPTVVVRNRETGHLEQLVGEEQITKDRIVALVAKVGRN